MILSLVDRDVCTRRCLPPLIAGISSRSGQPFVHLHASHLAICSSLFETRGVSITSSYSQIMSNYYSSPPIMLPCYSIQTLCIYLCMYATPISPLPPASSLTTIWSQRKEKLHQSRGTGQSICRFLSLHNSRLIIALFVCVFLCLSNFRHSSVPFIAPFSLSP